MYMLENVRMEHFSALFLNLFAQKRKRISVNKFGAGLEKAVRLPKPIYCHLCSTVYRHFLLRQCFSETHF